MSERSKGDTSSSLGTAAPPTSGRVVKNPLLSASVTGLTFDDFQNKPLLLPAAPPIVHLTPVVSRESTPLVTVGKSSDIDTENLSEINLNDTSVTSSSSNIADPSDENSNSLIESTNQIDNSILSQAASSFSQLPSVASSVFSTFSKKFNSSSGREDFNSNPQLDIQPFTTPFVGQPSVSQPTQIIPPPSDFGNQQHHQQQQIALPPQSQPQAPPAEPPTFYSPTEVPSAPSGPTCAPPASGQNTYRLSAKKKIYAQIPGLSSSHQDSSLPISATEFPPPIGFESLGAPAYSEHSLYEKPEERKGGLFSLSNLGVPNVLQNLSGFVQSATGISQRPQEQPFGSIQTGQAPQPAYYPQTSQFNLTGIEQIPSAANFFAPPVSSALQSTSFVPTQVPSELPETLVTPVASFAHAPQGLPSTGIHFLTQPPKSKTPEAGQPIFSQQQTFYQPTTSSSRPPSAENQFASQPTKSLTPDTNHSVKAFAPLKPSQPEFNSEKSFAGSHTNLLGPPPTADTSPSPKLFGPPPTGGKIFSGPLPKSVNPESASLPNLNLEQTASGPHPSFFGPPPIAGSHFSGPPPKRVIPESNLASQQAPLVSTTNIFGPPPTAGVILSGPLPASIVSEPTQTTQQVLQPGVNLAGPPESATSEANLPFKLFTPSLSSGQPPTSLSEGVPLSLETQLPPQVKPPSAGPLSSSFRLQKGTRLYKSPFAVVAPEQQPQVQITQDIFPPAPEAVTYFNPQQGFAPPQGQGISQPIPTKESILRPVQEASILPPKDNSVLQGIASPLGKAPEHSSTVEAVHFFNPQQGFAPPQGQGISQPIPTKESILRPVQEASILPPKDNSVLSGIASPLGKAPEHSSTVEAVHFFNPQQGFAQPQGQRIPQLIPAQESVIRSVQEASILPPKDNSVLHPSATAPPLNKAPDYPPTAEAVQFFNPQGFNSGPALFDPTKTAASLNILEPLAAPEGFSSKPTAEAINFFNPQALNSVPALLEPTKEVDPLNILHPLTDQVAVSTKPPSSPSSTNASPIYKVLERPTYVEGVNPQEITPPSVGLDTDTEQSPSADKNPSAQETYLSNEDPEQAKFPPSEQASIINPESEVNQEKITSLQEQQNTILPPPPAVNFGISTQSKETANFPPPPPQHSFENKPISNPYRKGLQPAHSQLPAPTSLSSFFTPIDQGNNFFQTINSGPVPEPQQPAANFFAETSFVDHQEKSLSPSSETCNTNTPKELSQEASKLSEETVTESQRIQPQTHLESTLPIEEPVIPEQDIPTSSEEPLRPEAAEKSVSPQPAENQLSFYKPDSAPPFTKELPVASKPEDNPKIASPLKSQDIPVPEPVPNILTGFFDQAAASTVAAPNPVVAQRASLPDPTTFFDSFSLVPSLGVPAPPTEDPNSQRIQNFFNNPPPKELDTVGDLNYNLVGSGLAVQNLQIRSLTPASNLAEPPSSSCSEFSELNSSLSAANRQPLIQAADSTKVSPEEEAIFESPEYQDLPEEIVNELKMANSLLSNNSPTNETYKPAVKHWFYKRKLDVKCLWTPFSFHDSALLEEAFLKGDEGPNLVAVEGGRFDVNISERTKSPVYWEGEPIEVKRCSWFYKASDSKYVPYEEETADLLEEEYKKASESCEWHKKIPISAGDIVVFHGPTVIVHFQPQQQIDSWGGATQTITRPRVVKRDLDDFNIDQGESHKVDHLLFMVHGIGSACDLKMRSVEEVVDEFRSIALQLVQSHYKNSVESGYVGRVEVLPVSWHSELHSEEFGIDEKLKSITLESIPKLRNFTNDTLLDILFYTSPMFCQRIINTVTSSMNEIYLKYKQRNPEFHGEVSLAGHSLGSLIMFDLLCHQRPHKQIEEKNMENPDAMTSDFPVESNQLKEEEEGKNITYKMGQAGTGQPFISYPQLLFQPKKFFALGSPIGMFVTIRGIDKLGLDFRLPTCPGFYNIFHPYDPVAYRLEALVNPDMNGIPPVLIPHHKGRKRMHLELKETMSRVGADLKQRFFETFRTTLDSVNFLTPKAKNDPKELKEEVDRLLELQAQQGQQTQSTASTSRSRANSNSTNQSDTDVIEIDFPLGKLNDSKRVDYVLQEAPLEFFNEYLFALSSHVCYWESEDTILFVMKQIYNEIGISPDSQVPQQTMTIERPSSSGSTTQQSPTS